MGCKICREKNTKIWNIKSKKYSYCPQCGFIQISREYFPERLVEKKRYTSHNNTPSNRGYLSYLKNILTSSFYPFVPAGNTVLDFGSGPQPVLAGLLQKAGYNVDFYDPFFAPSQDWKTRKYDAVTAIEVFEHLQDPVSEITTLLKVLKANGHLIIRTMLHNEEENFFSSWWYKEDITHISFYAEKTIRVMVKPFGLTVASIKNNSEIVIKK